MNQDHPTQAAGLARAGLHLGGLVLAVAISACGGSSSGDPTPVPPPPPAVDYEMTSGGTACGGGGCGGDSADGSGVGSGADGGDGAGGGLGEMRNVKVTASKPDGSVLASANLKDNLVSLYPRAYKGPIVLEFADDGSGNGAYFDEAKSIWIPLAGKKLHALIPALTHHVSANVLTEAAYRWAQRTYETTNFTATQMTTANETIRTAFNLRVPTGYKISDITNYSVAVSDLTLAGALPNTHAGRLGTLFAAFPKTALRRTSTLPKPAIAFADHLLEDILDDGVINASVVIPVGEEAYGVDLPQVLSDTVTEARATWGDPSQPAPTSAPLTCFNTALFTVGTKWDLLYLDTDFSGDGGTSDFSETAEVTRLTPFTQAGVASAIEVKDTFADGSFSLTYFDPDISGGLKNYGAIEQTSLGSTVTVYSPPFTNRMFLLEPDSTDRLRILGTLTAFDPAGNPIGTPLAIDVTQSTTFVNYEDVTVPAGTFKNACHYTQPDAQTGGKSDFWLTSSGQGILVLSKDFDVNGNVLFQSELKAGSVNGTPAR